MAAAQGGGLACLARFRADRENGLTRLTPPSPPPGAAIWLVVHRDNRHTPRIRTVLTHIGGHVQNLAQTLSPEGVDRSSGGKAGREANR